MSLKLIKEAQIITTVSGTELAVMKTLQQATGKSFSALSENIDLSWSNDDDQKYLQEIPFIAQEFSDEMGTKLNLNRRGDFDSVVYGMMEHDPKTELYDDKTRKAIANNLWLQFKSSKQQAKVSKMVQSHEEEERTRSALHDLVRDGDGPVAAGMQDEEDEEYGGIRAPNYQTKNGWSAEEPEGETADTRVGSMERLGRAGGYVNRMSGAGSDITYGPGSENEEYGTRQQNVRKLNPILDREMYRKNDAETIQTRQRLGSQENEERGTVPVAAGLKGHGDEVFKTRKDYLDSIRRAEERRRVKQNNEQPETARYPEEDEEAGVMSAKTGEQVTSKSAKTPEEIARQILTAPREVMNNATKSFKEEGADAWKNHGLPKNPHPIKSAAHRHWREGLRKAAMADLGLEPKPDVKPTKRR